MRGVSNRPFSRALTQSAGAAHQTAEHRSRLPGSLAEGGERYTRRRGTVTTGPVTGLITGSVTNL